MSLSEQQTSKPDGHAGVLSSMRQPAEKAREALQNMARSPKMTVPMGKKGIELATDRVRAVPAVSPQISMMIGMNAIGLGVAGIFFPKAVKRGLGIEAPTQVVQSVFGLREMWSGYSLAADPTQSGVLWARVAGDMFDIAALKALDRPSNEKRGNARLALGFVLAVTALDVITAVRMSTVKRTCE